MRNQRAQEMSSQGTAGMPREPDSLAAIQEALQRRHLITPFLLLLASHRPLTFIAGQLLYALAPCCALLGWQEAHAWAAFFSAPDANRRLTGLSSRARQQPRP